MRAILTYHSIDASGSAISIAPDVFRDHVRWLSQGRVRVTPLDQLLAPHEDDEDESDAVALTFDDGFANFTPAAEQLVDHGLPATLFVVTAHVGGTNEWGGQSESGIPTLPLLSWAELERLVARGVAIGAHTRTHRRLTGLPSSEVEDEMERCAEELRARLDVRPSWFAYPYGAVDDRIAGLATRFSAAVTTRFAPVRAAEPRSRIPRLDMHYFRRAGALEAWGTPRFARRLRWVAARRQARRVLTAGRLP